MIPSVDILDRIAAQLPRQRGNVSLSNRQVLEAILHVRTSGCAWRQLPKSFGNWHTVYTRMRRWSASGVLEPALQMLKEALAPPSASRARRRIVTEPAAPRVAAERLRAMADELRPLIFMLYMDLKQERSRLGVSQFEVAVMMTIEADPGIGASDIAHHLEVRPTTVSTSIRHLVVSGWVRSRRGETLDRRRVGLHVTPLGRKAMAEVRSGRSDLLTRQFNELEVEEVLALEAAVQPLKRLSRGLRASLRRRED